MSTTLTTAALLDSMGRFVANVGVPAAIAFFILYQITPKLDAQTQALVQMSTQLTVLTITCVPPQNTRGATQPPVPAP
jgi:hypothetical protein